MCEEQGREKESQRDRLHACMRVCVCVCKCECESDSPLFDI